MDCSPEYVDNYFGIYDEIFYNDVEDDVDLDGTDSDDGYDTECNSSKTNLTEPTTSLAAPATSTTSTNIDELSTVTTSSTKSTNYYTRIAKCHSFDQGGLFELHIVPREPFSMSQQMEKYLEAFESLLNCMADVQSRLEGASDKLASIRETKQNSNLCDVDHKGENDEKSR